MSGGSGARSRWRHLIWIVPTAIVVVVAVILIARWLRELAPVEEFLLAFPGETPLPEGTSVGTPGWVGWQHFFNAFFMVLIVKSGLAIRNTTRPSGYWTPKWPRPRGGQQPTRITLDTWFHLSLDVLWIVNGIVFVVLLIASGRWVRIVPTSWEVFPNAASALLQYASMSWPVENGWVNYNGLQLLTYFATVFIAAPLAFATGIRMSPIWPAGARRLNRVYPIEWARALHFPVMLYFVGFTIVHVTLVLATGALRNLNHVFAARDEVSWVGAALFAASLIGMTIAWLALGPAVLRPIAALTGKISR